MRGSVMNLYSTLYYLNQRAGGQPDHAYQREARCDRVLYYYLL